MTSQSGPIDRRHRCLRVWTCAQARAVVPYLASIMRSLREHRLDALRHHLAAKRLADKPGKPRRDTLLALEEAARDAHRADEEYQKTLAELESLGIHCLDPVAGRASFTVYRSEHLAEYEFDLFDPQPSRFWAEDEPCRGQGRCAY